MTTTSTPTTASSYNLTDTSTLSDREKEILTKLKAGQHEALDYLFDNYYNTMCNKALFYVKNTDRAEDIVQDVFLNIWKKRSEISINATLKGYLMKCVTNRSLNYLRDRKTHTNELDEQIVDNSLSIEERIYYGETEQIILDHINTLSPRCRQIFIMNRIDQMKYKEISQELGISIKTVEHHVAKGLHYMRERLTGLRKMSYCQDHNPN